MSSTAEELSRRAIEEDPEFAAAHDWPAWSLQHNGSEDPFPHIKRAAELARAASDRERYFILAHYHGRVGDTDKATAALEALVQLHPDHLWGSNNLAARYTREGRLQDAARVRMRHANVRQNDFLSNVYAAEAAVYSGNLTDAQRYTERARGLSPPHDPFAYGVSGFSGRYWLALLPAHQLWAQGYVAAAVDHVERAMRTFEPQNETEREFFAWTAGTLQLTFGRLNDAEQSFDRLTNVERVPWCVGWLELARLDWSSLKDRLVVFNPRTHLCCHVWLVLPGEGGVAP